MNRNYHRQSSNTSCVEDDDEDLNIEDYDIHDGDSNIVINAGKNSIQFKIMICFLSRCQLGFLIW